MLTELNHLPILPQKTDYRIALSGAGGIVNNAHLPAYRKAGFHVVGIYDLDRERTERTAARFELPRVYDTLLELAEDDAVDIVDVAIPATANIAVANTRLVDELSGGGSRRFPILRQWID